MIDLFCHPFCKPFSRFLIGCIPTSKQRKLLLLSMNLGLIQQAYYINTLYPSIDSQIKLLASRLKEIQYVLDNQERRVTRPYSLTTVKKIFNQRILLTLHNTLPTDQAGYAGKSLEKLAEQVRHNPVIFTGQVPFHEIKNFYSLFDICAYPRKNSLVPQLVPPLKILEAMALEKPVIASDLTCLKEIITDEKTGLLCQPDSVDSLKHKISQLYEDISLRQQLGKNAPDFRTKSPL